jgi:chemotaxis methyl-accepting protein methylase
VSGQFHEVSASLRHTDRSHRGHITLGNRVDSAPRHLRERPIFGQNGHVTDEPSRAEPVGSSEPVRFFRDTSSFAALVPTLDRYLERLPVQHDVRLWVPACSTGEEAYSMAMLLVERAQHVGRRQVAKVFATDSDEASLAVARAGRYPLGIDADVSPERLERFFIRDLDSYRVNDAALGSLIFAPHDVSRDPPFTHLDWIVCRQLAARAPEEARTRVLGLFEAALEPRGLLLLDPELMGVAVAGAFEVLDDRLGLLVRRPNPSRRSFISQIDPAWSGQQRTLRAERPRAGARRSAQMLTEPLGSLEDMMADLESSHQLLESMNTELRSLRERVQSAPLEALTDSGSFDPARAEPGQTLLSEVLHGLPLPVALLDADFSIALANPEFSRWAGVEVAECAGRALADVLPSFGEPEALQRLEELARGSAGTTLRFAGSEAAPLPGRSHAELRRLPGDALDPLYLFVLAAVP